MKFIYPVSFSSSLTTHQYGKDKKKQQLPQQQQPQ